MVGRLAYIRERLDTSIWLIPIGLAMLSALLAVAVLWLERGLGAFADLAMSVASARQVLGVIAGSIISVGGVAFSVIIVALTLTSGQYGPKILRNFLEDNTSKVTLGLFLGTYTYTLVILTGYTPADQPRLTVLGALLLALGALVGFVRFIHHTATDLQADKIAHRIGGQLQDALHAMAEEADSGNRVSDTLPWRRAARSHRAHAVASSGSGYVQTVDYDGLVGWCARHDCLLQIHVRAGDFVVEGSCLFKLHARDELPPQAEVVESLNEYLVLGPIRTPIQDPEHPITQLTQLAARALSPGINDPGTAITCIDWFSLALSRVVDRELPGAVFLDDDGKPRLLARISDFRGVLKAIYAPLRQFAGSEVSVVACLLEGLCRLAELTRRGDRLALIAMHGELIWTSVRARELPDFDERDIRQRRLRLQRLTNGLWPAD